MGERYTIRFSNISTTTVAKTLAMLATPSTRRARIKEISISFAGVTATDVPVLVQLRRFTADGTGTSFTPLKTDPASPAALCSAKTNYTAEGTGSDILYAWDVTPNGGLYTEQWPLGDEPVVAISGFIGLEVTAGVAVNASGYIVFEE